MGVCCSKIEIKEHIFYWKDYRTNQVDKGLGEAWNRYEPNLQTYLNEKFFEYMNGGAAEVKLIVPMQNFVVDFKKKLHYDPKSTSEPNAIIYHEYSSSLIQAIISRKIIV